MGELFLLPGMDGGSIPSTLIFELNLDYQKQIFFQKPQKMETPKHTTTIAKTSKRCITCFGPLGANLVFANESCFDCNIVIVQAQTIAAHGYHTLSQSL